MAIVVFDTNIFLSGFLFNGKPRQLIEEMVEGKFRVSISPEILDEIARVLSRPKFKLTAGQINFIIKEIESACALCFPAGKIENVCRDPDDHIILECALESRADFIVTGDLDLLTMKEYRKIKIVTADEFLILLDKLN